ncbi:tetrahydromethanopterin S-methyltransferase subunit F [Methanobacterium oryzae]|uniref:tetrahydromethanopterin S-methyltransferase subunit F n=1 Tax=Methanobacterium oryzae TaxID=69540 RepID=UPI003D1DEFD5
MVTFSNKPNIRGLRKTVEEISYSTQLIGREMRLFAGLTATRVTGMAMGFILALILVGGPIAYKALVGA